MPPPPEPRDILGLDPLASPRNLAAVLDNARRLQWAAHAGATQPLLRGKNLGLLCEDDADPQAVFFRDAATQLGAHVAHIRPSLSELTTPLQVQNTARMLGRLYDAVECQGVGAGMVRQVQQNAGVPVYDNIASRNHPTAGLAELLGGGGSVEDRRRFVLQATLLQTIADL